MYITTNCKAMEDNTHIYITRNQTNTAIQSQYTIFFFDSFENQSGACIQKASKKQVC